MSTKPGEGERRAISGYRHQYLVGAVQILAALEGGDLDWVRLADPEAGRVDDLQIARSARIDAYQVKWEQYSGSITLNDLVNGKGGDPSLILQLADGWERLQRLYPSHRVVVHLVTNAYPSSSVDAWMPETENKPAPYHFAAFIEQAWKAFQQNFDTEWSEVWKALETASGLDEPNFQRFVGNCRLDFQTQIPELDQDIRAIVDLLFETVASAERRVELNRDELLRQLGWSRRYAYLNKHEFPSPAFLYRPIQNTVRAVERAILTLPGGYLGVFGSPGSGKSTLLTQTLRAMPVRLVRYYAYVPEAQDPSILRGESRNFLHDVTLRLWEAGFGRQGRDDPTDRAGLLNSFHNQLAALGEDYLRTGTKTVILIDGLDHISREQNPERSLLRDLPLPDIVPLGVFIVLGSQTDEPSDLPPRVHYELKKLDRRIEMGRLSLVDVHSISEAAVPLGFDERQRIFELSGGHPLALIYLLKKLRQVDSPEAKAVVLTEAIPYDGDIEVQYWSHWRAIQSDYEIVNALGLLARVRGRIFFDWVSEWLDSGTLIKLQRYLFPYLEKDGENCWIFFHNSFRLFLIERTKELILMGKPDQQDRLFHRSLAEKYENSSFPWRWETLYHLYSAGDYDLVVNISTFDWFLSQVIALRPIDAIETDVRLALKAAGERRDVVALIRLTLVWASLEQRARVLEDRLLPDLLLDVGETTQAAEYIRDGNRLRIGAEQALQLSLRLFQAGLEKEGRRIFELAEPLELLSGRPIPDDNNRPQNLWPILKTWIHSAIFFRGIEDVEQVIHRVQIEPSRMEKESTTEEESLKLRNWLLFQSALGCCRLQNWNGWRYFYNKIDKEANKDLRFFTLLRSSEWAQEAGDHQHALELLETLIRENTPADIEFLYNERWDLEARISVAELLYFDAENPAKSRDWIADLPAIPLEDDKSHLEDKPSLHTLRFRLARLQYLFNGAHDPGTLVSQAEINTKYSMYEEDEEKASRRQIALAIYQLARLWAWGKSRTIISPTAFISEVRWILELFGPDWNKMAFRFRSLVSGARNEVLSFLVMAAETHGDRVVQTLQEEFARRWVDAEEGSSWWAGLQRDLVVELLQANGDQSWAKEQLERIERIMLSDLDIYQRVEECEAQAKAWLNLGERDRALANLKQMVQAARGIYSEKDYQLGAWVKWLKRINDLEPEKFDERAKLMLRRILSAHGNASGVSDAAKMYLEVVFRCRPSQSVHLLKYFQEEDIVSHQSGIVHILDEALKAPNPPIYLILYIITDLLIPFSKGAEPDLLESLILKAGELFGREAALEIARLLRSCVKTDASADSRPSWYKGIAGGLDNLRISSREISLDPADYEETNDHNSSSLDKTLYLKSGEGLSYEMALGRIRSLEDLQSILAEEDSKRTRYFEWPDVIEHLAVNLNTQKEVIQLGDITRPRLTNDWSRESHICRLLTTQSKRLLELGERKLAWSLVEQALNGTNASGWDPYWDGGVRHAAFRQMIAIDPERARDHLVGLYAIDLSERFRSSGRMLIHLEEVFELLSKDIPVTDIWPEIENYLDDLFVSIPVEPYPGAETLLDLVNEAQQNNTPDRALSDLLILYLDHPSFAVGQGAVRACYAALLKGYNSIVGALLNTVRLTDQSIERALMVLDAASLEDIKVVEPFTKVLQQLSLSYNFAIRTIAWKIYSRYIGISKPLPSVKRNISAIYNIHLPQLSTYRTEDSWSKDHGPRLLNDPAFILKPLDIELRIVARAAEVEEDNVLFRAMEFFRELEKQRTWLSGWGTLNDKKMAKFLHDVGLRISFNKPHIIPARYALAYVIAELYDGGCFPPEALSWLYRPVLNYDPEFIRNSAEPRPDEIAAMGGIPSDKRHFISLPENWLGTTNESLSLLCSKTSDEHLILGEWTHLRYLQDEWPDEQRFSFLSAVDSLDIFDGIDIEKGHPPFRTFQGISIEDYPSLNSPLDHILIAFHNSGVETPTNFWLALNPAVGRALGWRQIDGEWFRWEDSNGVCVVESRWWNDGGLYRFSDHDFVETGSGWLVLITESGLNQLKQWAKELKRGGVIFRSKGWHGNIGFQHAKEILPTISPSQQ